MGFGDMVKFKAKIHEKMKTIDEKMVSAEKLKEHQKTAELKSLKAEKTALNEALSKGISGEPPMFVGDSVEFTTKKAFTEEESIKKAQDSEVKKEAPRYTE